MIKRLVAFALWLQSRFPEKVVVTAEDYARQNESMGRLIERVEALAFASTAIDGRLATVEAKSVHKDAVKDLIAVVQTLKNDVDAMKVNAGWSKLGAKGDEIAALLNGEVI